MTIIKKKSKRTNKKIEEVFIYTRDNVASSTTGSFAPRNFNITVAKNEQIMVPTDELLKYMDRLELSLIHVCLHTFEDLHREPCINLMTGDYVEINKIPYINENFAKSSNAMPSPIGF